MTAGDVQHALDAEVRREDRLRERTLEDIARRTVPIASDGSTIGQVNALSLVQLGRYAFGRPSRVTARVRLGQSHLVDIEREVELGGPIHSKGVLILGGFLAGRYVPDQPLWLSASLVFEQRYGSSDEIVSAVEAGPFHVWAVETGDQAMDLLTGAPANRTDV